MILFLWGIFGGEMKIIPEATRGDFNAVVDEKDLCDTNLYAFHPLVKNGFKIPVAEL